MKTSEMHLEIKIIQVNTQIKWCNGRIMIEHFVTDKMFISFYLLFYCVIYQHHSMTTLKTTAFSVCLYKCQIFVPCHNDSDATEAQSKFVVNN